jgi:glucose/mannose transport system permease protein
VSDVARASSAGGGVLGRVVVYGLLALVAAYYLLPLFVMLSTSVKSLEEIRTGNLLSLPQHIGFEAWAKAWGTIALRRIAAA